MWFCPGQARADLAFFARLRPACGTTNRQRVLLRDFHAYTMRGFLPTKWSIVTIAQTSARRIISLEKGRASAASGGGNVSDDRQGLPQPFLRSDRMLKQLATDTNKSPYAFWLSVSLGLGPVRPRESGKMPSAWRFVDLWTGGVVRAPWRRG